MTLLRQKALWLLTSIALATEVATYLGFRLRQGFAGQVAGFRKDAPSRPLRVGTAGCFTSKYREFNIALDSRPDRESRKVAALPPNLRAPVPDYLR